MLKNNKVKGFTLVELIVVLAVIGVLTAVLVPSVMGYVKKARFAAANANAKSLLNAGMLACRESDVTKPIPEGIYTQNAGKTYGVDYHENETMNKYIKQHFPQADETLWAVMVKDDVVTAAFVVSDKHAKCIGTYPHPNKEDFSLDDKSFEAVLEYAEEGIWS